MPRLLGWAQVDKKLQGFSLSTFRSNSSIKEKILLPLTRRLMKLAANCKGNCNYLFIVGIFYPLIF